MFRVTTALILLVLLFFSSENSVAAYAESQAYETSIIDFAEGVIEYNRLTRIDMYGDTTELGQDIIRRKALKKHATRPWNLIGRLN